MLRRHLANPAATTRLGQQLAAVLKQGDVVALTGDLGAGKTTLACALIQQRYKQADLPPEPVSSPSFSLVHIYDPPPCPIWHLDLYRLNHPAEVHELGWEDAHTTVISLIEWPQRLGTAQPVNPLTITLDWPDTPTPQHSTSRMCQLEGGGDWPQRLAGLSGDLNRAAPPTGATHYQEQSR